MTQVHKGGIGVRVMCALVLPALLLGCRSATVDLYQLYPYEPSTHDRAVIEAAITMVNAALLADPKAPELVGEWADGKAQARPRAVRVYWVGGRGLQPTRSDMAFVASECRCVVIQADEMLRFIGYYSRDGVLTLNTAPFLAYVLLHEMGHIESGHPGRLASEPASVPDVPISSIEKEQERRADAYAASQVRGAVLRKNLNGTRIDAELSKFSFNLLGMRLLYDEGKDFEDTDESHENWELRALRMGVELHPFDPNAQENLELYLKQRSRIQPPEEGLTFHL